MTNFSDFALAPSLIKALDDLGFKVPTPIQDLAIPQIIKGLDLIASAQTGTGKTAAFMLPALHRLTSNPRPKGKGPLILVLVPTRELAIQVANETKKFSKYLPELKTVCIYGGVPYPPQNKSLNQPYDILVSTPGRLIDHMESGRINLSKVQYFVLDEADRMLDMGFLAPVEKIAAAIPRERQTLLFSATLDPKIHKISKKMQNEPVEIKVEPDLSIKGSIEQRFYIADGKGHKMRLLDHILTNTPVGQAIVFTATKRQADELALQLQEKGLRSDALHGDMNQRRRTRTTDRLRRGQIQILVATDVAARGIDIPALSHVINMDLPYQLEDYVHRIGRTGRAGSTGIAITFASHSEKPVLSKISKMTGSPIEIHTIQGLEPTAKVDQKQPHFQQRNKNSPDRKKRGSFSGNRKFKPFRKGKREKSPRFF